MQGIHVVLLDDEELDHIRSGSFATIQEAGCSILIGHRNQEPAVREALEERGVPLDELTDPHRGG